MGSIQDARNSAAELKEAAAMPDLEKSMDRPSRLRGDGGSPAKGFLKRALLLRILIACPSQSQRADLFGELRFIGQLLNFLPSSRAGPTCEKISFWCEGVAARALSYSACTRSTSFT